MRIFFFLSAGILFARQLPDDTLISSLYLSIVLAIILIVLFIYARWVIDWRKKWLPGLLAGGLLFTLGILITNMQFKSEISPAPQFQTDYIAQLVKDPVLSDKSVKTVLKVNPVSDSISQFYHDREVLAYLVKDSLSSKLRIGDVILINGKLSKPDVPRNPYEFDYPEFLALNGIYHTVFINSNAWKYIDHSNVFSLRLIASNIRNYLLGALAENGLNDREFSVAAAVILGYDNLMDPDLEQDYVAAGAMHILCVSGLHVGVIYLVINYLLGFLNRNRVQKYLKVIILLLTIWTYALITGLSPSVQRASLMLTVFIIGNMVQRNRDPYNSLAASAVLMLLVNPLLLFNVGFQLSYSAVLGILTFHNPLYRLIYFKNPILDKTWSIFVLSFSAQLGTFPLAAHYFHFFPTYFWLTNLFIFPLSFAIISTGFAFLLISWLPFIPKLVGLALSGMIYLLNSSVGLVRYLPYHGLDDLYFPWIKVILIYVLILLTYQLFIKRRIRFLLPIMIVALFLLGFQAFRNYHLVKQEKMVVYSINRQSAVEFIQGRNSICLLDSTLFPDQKKQNYHLKNARVNWGLSEQNSLLNKEILTGEFPLWFDSEFGLFGNKKFVIVDGRREFYDNKGQKLKVDILVITGRKRLNMQVIASCFEFDTMILDGSVPYWKRKRLIEEAESRGLKYYDVSQDGAYILDL